MRRRHPALTFIAVLCFVGWLVQFVGHQLWLYFPFLMRHGKGFSAVALTLFLTIVAVPALFVIFRAKPVEQPRSADGKRNPFESAAPMLLALVCVSMWMAFARPVADYPRHVFGDEGFHSSRTAMMCDDARATVDFLRGKRPAMPFHGEHYVQYPSLAYVPNATIASLLGDGSKLENQRIALFPHYMAVALVLYFFARAVTGDWKISALLGLVSATSPLLISFTMSFYIDMQYVAVVLGSIALLHRGIENDRADVVTASVLLVSIAPIIRESAFPSAFAIGIGAALWALTRTGKNPSLIRRLIVAGYLFLVAMVPFVVFYVAKSNYTNRDREETSIAYLFQQDYAALALYALLYVGPVVLILAASALRRLRRQWILLTVLGGMLAGEILICSVFTPGYMPWTRNYLFVIAPLFALAVLGCSAIKEHWPQRLTATRVGIIATIATNAVVGILFLRENRFFHESEAILDDPAIATFVRAHEDKFRDATIYGQRPGHMPSLSAMLPRSVSFTPLDRFADQWRFLPFAQIREALPVSARYVLFYWYNNNSRPWRFHEIWRAQKPNREELADFEILAEVPDPWSDGRSGVMLLERTRFP